MLEQLYVPWFLDPANLEIAPGEMINPAKTDQAVLSSSVSVRSMQPPDSEEEGNKDQKQAKPPKKNVTAVWKQSVEFFETDFKVERLGQRSQNQICQFNGILFRYGKKKT